MAKVKLMIIAKSTMGMVSYRFLDQILVLRDKQAGGMFITEATPPLNVVGKGITISTVPIDDNNPEFLKRGLNKYYIVREGLPEYIKKVKSFVPTIVTPTMSPIALHMMDEEPIPISVSEPSEVIVINSYHKEVNTEFEDQKEEEFAEKDEQLGSEEENISLEASNASTNNTKRKKRDASKTV